MGLFSNNKKLCPVCGEPTPRLFPTKVEGNAICKECSKKIYLPNGKLEKIQIKYSSQQESEGSIVFKTASSTNHTTNKHYSTYENDVDAFLLYNALTDEVYYVPMEIIGTKKTLTMRMQPSKNGQIKNCLFTSDYLAENYF